MKNENIISLLSLFIVSCGFEHEFSENYRTRPAYIRTEDSSDIKKFTARLTSLSDTVGYIAGSIAISINQTDVETTTLLQDVPQILILGQRSIRNISCSELASTFSPLDILNNTTEFKDLNLVDSGSRESLIAELNDTDPHNGDSLELVGKSYVIEAYVDELNPEGHQIISLIPIACGPIEDG